MTAPTVTSPRPARPTSTRTTSRGRLPTVVYVLAAGTFLMGATEFMIAGLLPEMAGDLAEAGNVGVRGKLQQLLGGDGATHMRVLIVGRGPGSSNVFGDEALCRAALRFESGLAAKVMGIIPSVVFGGCMTIMVVVATWWKAPSLKKLEY